MATDDVRPIGPITVLIPEALAGVVHVGGEASLPLNMNVGKTLVVELRTHGPPITTHILPALGLGRRPFGPRSMAVVEE